MHDSYRAILCMLFCPHIHTHATQDEVQFQKGDHEEVSKLGIKTSKIPLCGPDIWSLLSASLYIILYILCDQPHLYPQHRDIKLGRMIIYSVDSQPIYVVRHIIADFREANITVLAPCIL